MPNAYESQTMYEATGETLRPGGFTLTHKAVNFCALDTNARVLDIGCGRGATLNYLYRTFGIQAVGIDPSITLLEQALAKNPWAKLIQTKAEAIDFASDSFECLFAECTLSLMDDLDAVLRQAYRVLSPKGWFVITDVYAKNPEHIASLEAFGTQTCMRGIHDLKTLQCRLEALGFTIALLEDCSEYLKALMVKIVFEHGSMEQFWKKTSGGSESTSCCFFSDSLKRCKPGYFILIARKGERHG